MMTNPVRDAVYTVTVPADLTASVLAACRAEVAAGIKRTPTPMMRVLPPLTAAAACVAVLGVALYLGGNTPDELPVLPPVGNESTTTAEVTDTTDTTANTTTTTTEKPTTGSTAKPTTTTTTAEPTTTTTTAKPTTTKTTAKTDPTTTSAKEKPLITADEPLNYFPAMKPQRNSEKLIHSWLKRKMELYKGQDVLYAVIVEVFTFPEEVAELYPPYGPRPMDEWESEEDWYEYAQEYFERYLDQRVEKLKEIIGEELIPVSTSDKYGAVYTDEDYAFIMDLTAEEINELGQCGCFFIRLRPSDGDGATSITISH